METLRQFVEHASGGIDRIFRKSGIIRPMWHAVALDGEELIFPTPHPDKDIAVAMVRALFELRDVVRYAFMDEAWMVAAFSKDSTPEQLAAVHEATITGASASPAREEVVMICAEDHAEGQTMVIRRIIRPAGKRPRLGPLQFDPRGGSMVGRFVGMLPRKTSTVH